MYMVIKLKLWTDNYRHQARGYQLLPLCRICLLSVSCQKTLGQIFPCPPTNHGLFYAEDLKPLSGSCPVNIVFASIAFNCLSHFTNSSIYSFITFCVPDIHLIDLFGTYFALPTLCYFVHHLPVLFISLLVWCSHSRSFHYDVGLMFTHPMWYLCSSCVNRSRRCEKEGYWSIETDLSRALVEQELSTNYLWGDETNDQASTASYWKNVQLYE